MSEDTEEALIVAERRDLPRFSYESFNANAIALKDAALSQSALITKPKDRDSKLIAVRAQTELKRVIKLVDKARVTLKEPILNAGRQLDAICVGFCKELNLEYDRVASAVAEFDNDERIRIAEEEKKQREELERIEREKQAEIERLRKEQEEAERKAKEAQEAAQRAADEAKSKKDREKAEKLRVEAAALQQSASQTAMQAQKQVEAVQEKAADAAYIASRPVERTIVPGQRASTDWEITSISEWVLSKARPDLVTKITFDMRALKAELTKGVKLPGVEAKEVSKAGVRLAPERKAIDV
jgi:hypothetical protein